MAGQRPKTNPKSCSTCNSNIHFAIFATAAATNDTELIFKGSLNITLIKITTELLFPPKKRSICSRYSIGQKRTNRIIDTALMCPGSFSPR